MSNTTKKDPIFPEGLRAFAPHENAPDFVLASVVATPSELLKWLDSKPELQTDFKGQKQVRLQLKKSQSGTIYFEVDTFKKGDAKDSKAAAPVASPAAGNKVEAEDDLPF